MIKPEAIYKFAVKTLTAEAKEIKAGHKKRISEMDDAKVLSYLGKRERNKVESGKLTMKEARAALIAKDDADTDRDLNDTLAEIKVGLDKPLPRSIRVEVTWKKHRTWGFNPFTEVWADGYSEGTASGCGYDKESAAFAQAAKQNPTFARLVATIAYLDHLKEKKTGFEIKTYGYRFGVSGARFEGGVGYSCHDRIIKICGYKIAGEFHPKSADCYEYSLI